MSDLTTSERQGNATMDDISGMLDFIHSVRETLELSGAAFAKAHGYEVDSPEGKELMKVADGVSYEDAMRRVMEIKREKLS